MTGTIATRHSRYFFIQPDDGGKTIFCFAAWTSKCNKLKVGDKVIFDLVENVKRPGEQVAVNVRSANPRPAKPPEKCLLSILLESRKPRVIFSPAAVNESNAVNAPQ
jgi:cold shock CspA family protein